MQVLYHLSDDTFPDGVGRKFQIAVKVFHDYSQFLANFGSAYLDSNGAKPTVVCETLFENIFIYNRDNMTP